MNIGDILVLTPSVQVHGRDDQPLQALPCRVVYIHPQRRFFTAEFRSEMTGLTFREAFPFPGRAEIVREQPRKEPADKKKQFGPASLRRALEKGKL